jgi:hypothetical protein
VHGARVQHDADPAAGPGKPVTLPGRQVKLTSLMPAAPKRLVSPLISIMPTTMPAGPAVSLRPIG